MLATIQKQRISAVLPHPLVEEMQRTARKKNISQSFIVQQALEKWFKERLSQDAEDLANMNFNDLPSEDDWCKIQSQI